MKLRGKRILIVFFLMSLTLFGLGACESRQESGEPDKGGGDAVSFSLPSGAYGGRSRKLRLSNESGYPIYYTTDGSVPGKDSFLYSDPIRLTKEGKSKRIEEAADLIYVGKNTIYPANGAFPEATVIRAACLMPDGSFGTVSTQTYFIGVDLVKRYGCAVISIIADPEDLLDYDRGILVRGALFDQNLDENYKAIEKNQFQDIKANFMGSGREWEREAYIQLFDESNEVSAGGPCGIRVRGAFSRALGQKSFNVYFRKDYGQKELAYELFPDNTDINGNTIGEYKSFMLRNGGNDADQLKFKDAAIQKLLAGNEYSVQASRPAVLFLNGEYYGVINLGEKYSDDYVESHYGIDSDNVIIIEDGELDEGEDEDIELYEELAAFADKDLTDPKEWEAFSELADIDSMAQYYAAEIYIANWDFNEEKNIRLWRSRENDGTPYGDTKWRWMLFDTEYSSGMYRQKETSPEYDSLEDAYEECPLFASAMKNEEFRQKVFDEFRNLAENDLAPDRVAEQFEKTYAEWEKYYDDNYARFGMPEKPYDWWLTEIEDFFANRVDRYSL